MSALSTELGTVPENTPEQRASAELTIKDLAWQLHDPCTGSKKNQTVCTHPDHPRDAAAARLVLEAVGLVPTVYDPARRLADGRPNNGTGLCPGECGRRHSLRLSGVLQRHKVRDGGDAHCTGSGQRPVPDEGAEAS